MSHIRYMKSPSGGAWLKEPDCIKLVVDNGQRLLQGLIRVRLLTEEKLRSLSKGSFLLYRERVRILINHAANCTPLRDPDTIRAFDFMRKSVQRERKHRKEN